MSTPETIKTDNGKSFLSQTFGELLDEMKEQGSGTFTLDRADGGALALLTTDRRMVEAIKGLVEVVAPMQEASHAAD